LSFDSAGPNARLNIFLLAPRGATPGDSQTKLIKEDHFCMHHEDVETEGETITRESKPKSSLHRDLDQATSVHRNAWPHILAAIRLFTCQRAFIYYDADTYVFVSSCSFPQSQPCGPRLGRRILSSSPPLSTGVAEFFSASPTDVFSTDFEASREAPTALPGRFLSAPADENSSGANAPLHGRVFGCFCC
jgi:hypothetical protein